MSSITPIPTVTYHWSAVLPQRGWTGTVELPDCAAACEPVTRALLTRLRERGELARRERPVFIWRRKP